MSYKIKKEKIVELKDGRSNSYIASKIGCTEQHVGKIFLGMKNCSKSVALLLVSFCQKINIDNIDDEILDTYFDKVE